MRAGKRAITHLRDVMGEKAWSECLAEASIPLETIKEASIRTIMGFTIAMVVESTIPGSGIVSQMTAALLSAGVT